MGDAENFTVGVDYIPFSADVNRGLYQELIQQLMQTKLNNKTEKEPLTQKLITTLHIM